MTAATLTQPEPGTIHVWVHTLGDHAPPIELLSPDEQAKNARLRRRADRRRHTASRALIRSLLGRYTDQDPHALTFSTECNHCGADHGKPHLQPNPDDLRFNLSHACSRIILAVTVGQEVGIDIEHDHGEADLQEVLHPTLQESPVRNARTDPAHDTDDRPLASWTRHEAYLKMLGHGLVLPDQPKTAWPNAHLSPLDAGPGYVATLACQNPPTRVETRPFEWSPAA